jgi:transposase
MYGREGVELDRSTLADWVGQAHGLLEPLVGSVATSRDGGGETARG